MSKLENLRQKLGKKFTLNVQEFDKDDDASGHVDLIYALANLRAENYSLE
jgi:hypothetical protein